MLHASLHGVFADEELEEAAGGVYCLRVAGVFHRAHFATTARAGWLVSRLAGPQRRVLFSSCQYTKNKTFRLHSYSASRFMREFEMAFAETPWALAFFPVVAKVWLSGAGERWRSSPEVYLRLLETKK